MRTPKKPKVTYLYPKSLSEFKDGDIYEIKYSIKEEWYATQTYNISNCSSRKNYINYLIKNYRIRIVKNE